MTEAHETESGKLVCGGCGHTFAPEGLLLDETSGKTNKCPLCFDRLTFPDDTAESNKSRRQRAHAACLRIYIPKEHGFKSAEHAPVDPDRCDAYVTHGYRAPTFTQCERKAVNKEKGFQFCGQHTPSVIAAKRKAEEDERRARANKISMSITRRQIKELTALLRKRGHYDTADRVEKDLADILKEK